MASSKSLSTGIVLAIVTVIIGLVAAVSLFVLDSPQQKSAQTESQTNDNRVSTKPKHPLRESSLPAELTAEMQPRGNTWTGVGPVKDGNLKKLAREHKELPTVYLNQTEITGKGIAALKGHGVTELEIIDQDINSEMTSEISKIEGIKKLFLKDQSVNNDTLKALTGPKSVEAIHFKNAMFNSDALQDWHKKFPNLRILLFISCPNVDDSVLKHLYAFKHLDQFTFINTKVTPEAALQAVDTLSPTVFGYRGPRSHVLTEGFKSQTVKDLDLSGTTFNDKCIDSLSKLKNLHSLYLDQAQGLTEARVARLRKNLPKCNLQLNDGITFPETEFIEAEKDKGTTRR